MKWVILICAVFGLALFFNHKIAITRAAKSSAATVVAPIAPVVAAPIVEELPPSKETLEARRLYAEKMRSQAIAQRMRRNMGEAAYKSALWDIRVDRANCMESDGYSRKKFDKVGIKWEDICNDSDEELLVKYAEGLERAYPSR